MKKRRSTPIIERTAVTLMLLLLLFTHLSAPIGSVPKAPNPPDHSHAQAVILYNLEHREILLEHNAQKTLFPASTVKIMTGFLASQLLSERMEEAVTVTKEMIAGASGNRMNLAEGEVILIRDLYYGAITGGYNDACTALAVLASGSISAFVDRMNEQALSLGMYGTTYQNPTGLHSPSMVTTAYDTLLLSLAASTNERYMDAASTVKYEIAATNKNSARSFYNRNYLIASAVTTAYHNPYAEGLNGGVTDEGGWCVSAKAFRNELSWYCVVLGGEEDKESNEIFAYSIANDLLSWGARGYTEKTVVTAGTKYASIPIEYASIADSTEDGLSLIAGSDLSVFVPQSTEEGESGLSYSVRLSAPTLCAPIKAGEEVGVLIVTFNELEIGRVPLLTEKAVERNSFTYSLNRMKTLPQNRFFQGFFFSFLILLTLYVSLFSRFRHKPRLRSRAYVPIPFRDNDEGNDQSAQGRSPSAPSDPYSSAAESLERKKQENKKI